MTLLSRSPVCLLLLLFCLGFLASCGRPQARRSDREHTNELINSSSPYLLQHAHNPVNWYPYGKKALDKAEKENKLMVISVGYAACHWCHVMEEETFEDTVAANAMNKHYVSVKVDREERPDVDDVYMSACQLVSQEPCGWPLNVFCLPDGRPFFAVTYAPREEWIGAIEHFARMYEEEPETLEDYAQRLTEGVVQSSLLPPIDSAREVFPPAGMDTVARRFLRTVDLERGGHQGSPKFPLPSHFAFLLEYHHYSGDPQALKAVEATLQGMARGGIYDQVGGGFARYSTDDRWHIPHFEKMLYDNAQLVSLYAQAWRVDPKPIYRKVVDETLQFVERELMHPEQGFYSSLDADSEGEEGTFYVWTADDLKAALPAKGLREIVEKAYDFSPIGNWEGYKNVLHLVQTEAELAADLQLSAAALRDSLNRARALMLEYRSRRERPGLDDKILTAWNGLMVQAYLQAHHAFGSPEYLQTALKNGRFLRDRMMDEDGRLWRIYKDDKRSINGFLDDYALTTQAFIALYEATFDESWLQAARKLTDYAHTHFFDERSGLYYFTSDLDPPLVTRKMEIMDDVIPASNSVMAHNLFKLGHFFYDEAYLQRARHMMSGIYETLQEVEQPHYYSNWSRLYLRYLQPAWEVAIVGPRAEVLRQEMQRHFIPNAMLLGGEGEGSLELLQGKLQEGDTYIYVCQNKVCRLPVQEVEEALAQMQ